MKKAYSFDDVLLKPKFSDIDSRSEIILETSLGEDLKFALPVIASPMDTVTESRMASAMAKLGGLGVLHRYNSIAEQVKMAKSCHGVVAAAIGVPR